MYQFPVVYPQSSVGGGRVGPGQQVVMGPQPQYIQAPGQPPQLVYYTAYPPPQYYAATPAGAVPVAYSTMPVGTPYSFPPGVIATIPSPFIASSQPQTGLIAQSGTHFQIPQTSMMMHETSTNDSDGPLVIPPTTEAPIRSSDRDEKKSSKVRKHSRDSNITAMLQKVQNAADSSSTNEFFTVSKKDKKNKFEDSNSEKNLHKKLRVTNSTPPPSAAGSTTDTTSVPAKVSPSAKHTVPEWIQKKNAMGRHTLRAGGDGPNTQILVSKAQEGLIWPAELKTKDQRPISEDGTAPASPPPTSSEAKSDEKTETVTSILENLKKMTPVNRKSESGRWTEEEDERLRQAVAKFNARNWKEIAKLVPGRDFTQCSQRWKKVLDPNVTKGQWSREEDELLLSIVSERHFKNWGHVAKSIPGRSAKQCRERYNGHLDPSLTKGNWTKSEDDRLMDLMKELGCRWSAIARCMPGRTDNQVKARIKTLQREQDRNRQRLKKLENSSAGAANPAASADTIAATDADAEPAAVSEVTPSVQQTS